jgi:hypothetical protein
MMRALVLFGVPLCLAATSTKTVEEVLAGVVEGFGLSVEKECFDDAKSEFTRFDSAVVSIEKKDADDVKQGIAQLATAAQEIPSLIQACKSAEQDAKAEAEKIEKALELMKHPMQFAYHVGHDLLLNRVDIFHEVDAAVTAYKAAQWEVFGQNVGAALNKLIVGTEMLVALPPAEAKNVEEVLAGVLEGFGLTTEKACLDGATSDFDEFDAAVQLLEKKDMDDMKKGLEQLATAAQEIPSLVQTCKSAEQDAKAEAEKIEAALELMKHPMHFACHVGHDLVVNRVDIFNEVNAAVTAYKAAQWEAFGQNVGAALNKLIVGYQSLIV